MKDAAGLRAREWYKNEEVRETARTVGGEQVWRRISARISKGSEVNETRRTLVASSSTASRRRLVALAGIVVVRDLRKVDFGQVRRCELDKVSGKLLPSL